MAVTELVEEQVGVVPACAALGVSRATWYRRRQPDERRASGSRRRPARRLSEQERSEALELLHSERFVDCSPAQVVYTLMDEDRWVCSESSMYRLLREQGEVRERRNQLSHPQHAIPRLEATAPNQVWTWDITKLRTVVKWKLLYLYVLLDLYSRYVVGWLLAWTEKASLAEDLISRTVEKYGLERGELTLHSDRGSAATANSFGQLLEDLGITPSHSRPRVSNDNPYSESQFKTFKSRPGFPARFDSEEHARGVCRQFFTWYNWEHKHSQIAYLPPADVFFGRASEKLLRRARVLERAYEHHPERFVRGCPTPLRLPPVVTINPLAQEVIDGTDLP